MKMFATITANSVYFERRLFQDNMDTELKL